MFLQVSTEGGTLVVGLFTGPWSHALSGGRVSVVHVPSGMGGYTPPGYLTPSKEHGIYPIPRTEFAFLLPPTNIVCEGYVFTGVCPQGKGSAPLHAGTHPPGRHPPCAVHAGIRSTSGGTHPTGMHSCLFINLGV